ncbi:hypothetical protein ACLOAV_001511 [Pseudogymnoascus australis]
MRKIGGRLRQLLVAAVGASAASHSEGLGPSPRSAHNLPPVRKSSGRLHRLLVAVGASAASLSEVLLCNQPLTEKCAQSPPGAQNRQEVAPTANCQLPTASSGSRQSAVGASAATNSEGLSPSPKNAHNLPLVEDCA